MGVGGMRCGHTHQCTVTDDRKRKENIQNEYYSPLNTISEIFYYSN
jgi:hypothetical protein